MSMAEIIQRHAKSLPEFETFCHEVLERLTCRQDSPYQLPEDLKIAFIDQDLEMKELSYRSDIDGLRALAVLPVIIYHAGASWMPGGFIGVDVFFVISGYLISSIIIREIQADNFSFLSFYERRIRRIIPALLVMLIAVVIVFQVFSLPNQSLSSAESGIAALLSVSNFYFWKSSGYFAPTAEFLPLLHTWSLAVEEQFYFIFPIMLLVVSKIKVPIKWIILIFAIVAFLFGFWLSISKPAVAYYLLPARSWELAVGAIIAAGVIPKIKSKLLSELAPAFGVGLIVFSLFWIRSDMVFPGWVALMPCLGAGIVIHAGGRSWVAQRILSAQPMVYVGLLSYSLYLWHWPVLAFLRVRTASIHLDPLVAVLAIALTVFLAWLSWRFIERPFRNPRSMSANKMLSLLGVGSFIVILVGSASIATSGFPSRLTKPAQIALDASKDVDPLRDFCQGTGDRSKCRFGNPALPVTYAIVGDSHAAALRTAVETSEIMGDAAGTLYWAGACPLLEGASLKNHPGRTNCASFKSAVWKEIEANSDLDTIILAGRWPFQITGWLPETAGSYRMWLEDDLTTQTSIEENLAVFKRSLSRTLDRLTDLGKNVYIIGAVPEPGFDVPQTVAMAKQRGSEVPRGIRRDNVERRAGTSDQIISALVRNRENVMVFSIWPHFCGKEWCAIEQSGVPLYYDDDHLSVTGAKMMGAIAIQKAH